MLIHNFGGQVQVVLETNSWIFTKRAKSQLKSRLNYSSGSTVSTILMLLFDEKRHLQVDGR